MFMLNLEISGVLQYFVKNHPSIFYEVFHSKIRLNSLLFKTRSFKIHFNKIDSLIKALM